MKKNIEKNSGLTLVEVIMSFSILGIVIAPILSMFILAAKITVYSEKEYKTTQIAIQYIEEIKSNSNINKELYTYNSQNESYERCIDEVLGNYGVKITIKSDASNLLHTIVVSILEEEKVIKSVTATKVFR